MSIFRKHYYYHLTPQKNLESIRSHGLRPSIPKRFAPLSPEAHDRKPKVFLLPTLRGIGLEGFLEEWWHGDIADIIVLRCQLSLVHASKERYYAAQEVWVYETIEPSLFVYKPLNQWKKRWLPLCD